MEVNFSGTIDNNIMTDLLLIKHLLDIWIWTSQAFTKRYIK